MFNLSDHISSKDLSGLCRKYHVRKLFLFGSALRDQLRPDSDIDLLVEFEDGHTPGLLSLCRLEGQLSERVGRKVDLRTAGDLSRYFREDVIKSARVAYGS